MQTIWHAKIVNVKIHATIKFAPQIQIAQPPTIEPFVAAKEVSAAIHLPNVDERNYVHIMPIVRCIFRAVKENALTHVPLNAKIAVHAKS